MRYVDVQLPYDRREPGLLSLVEWSQAVGPRAVDGQFLPEVLMSFPVFGKADGARAGKKGNPDRHSWLPWGDFPFGVYDVGLPLTQPASEARSYGPAFIPLKPSSKLLCARVLCALEITDVMEPAISAPWWDAWRATHEDPLRTGLGLHGGHRTTRGGYWHKFRSTHGCLRGINTKIKWFAVSVSLDRPAFMIARPIELQALALIGGYSDAASV